MLKKILKRVDIKQVSYVLIANILGKFLGFIIFYVLAKYLSVKSYGVLTVLLALITTVSDLINSGLNGSIIRFVSKYRGENNTGKINELISTMFFNYILIGTLIIFSSLFLAEDLSYLLFKENYVYLIIWTAFGVLFIFLYGIFSAVFQALEEYKKYLVQMTSLPAIRILGLLFLFFTGRFTLEGVVILYCITPFAAMLIGAFLAKEVVELSLKHYCLKSIKEISHFGKWMLLWGIFLVIQSRINVYLLVVLTVPDEVSYLDVANKFASIIMIFFTSYSILLNPKLAKLISKDEMKKEFKNITKVVIFFSGYLLVCACVSPFIIQLVFGTKYEKSIIPLIITILFYVPYIWNVPYNSCLFALGKSWIFFVDALISTIITVIGSLILIPKYGATGAVFAQGASISISLVISRVAYAYYMHETGELVS